MPLAYSILPGRFADVRHEALEAGLKRVGYEIRKGAGGPNDERDILITWTVHKGTKQKARDQFEAAGGRVIVCEEAHIQRIHGETYFSLCLHDHNGAGTWKVGGADRWNTWGIPLRAWRHNGTKILVREQRGIGSELMASPPEWHVKTVATLRRITDRPVEIVTHPKTLKRRGERVPTADDLFADAWCVVIWASHMGTEALIHGVPVFRCAPHFFLEDACGTRLEDVDDPPTPQRLPAFQRFAWAQWSMREIRNGTAFAHLLQ